MSDPSKLRTNTVSFSVDLDELRPSDELEVVRQPLSDEPLVSVMISCYNSGKFIKRTLQSVLGQSYQNLEVIV